MPVQRPLRKKLAASTSHCLTIANATIDETINEIVGGSDSSIKKINEELGTTILMVTHDITIVEKMKKRVLVLKEGRLVKDYKEGTYKHEEF